MAARKERPDGSGYGSGTRERRTRVLILALILLVGLALRAGYLRRECPWYDEIITLRHLDAPDLGTFLDRIRPQNMALPPVYFSLEYGWARVCGHSETGLRLLSISLGLLTILLVYHLGRMVFGSGAGLVAACGLAVNAFSVRYSQEVRMYALVMFLAAASAYTFLHLLRRWNTRVFIVHVLADALMVWTHPFALLVFAPEGLILLGRWRDARRTVALWCVMHALIAASILIWLTTRDQQTAMAGVSWAVRPAVLFRSEVPSLELLLLFWLGKSTAVPDAGIPAILAPLRSWVDATLLICFFGSAAYALRCVAGRRREGGAHYAANQDPARREVGFLLLWLAVPPAILFGASHVWVPSFAYRYVLYSVLPAHLLIGGTVAGLPPWRKRLAVAVLVALWGYQAALLSAAPLRPNWRGAAATIAASPYVTEPILALKYQNACAVKYYLGPIRTQVEAAPSVNALAHRARAALESAPGVWVLLNDTIVSTSRASEQFEAILRESALNFTKATFPNASPVFVYHLTRPQTSTNVHLFGGDLSNGAPLAAWYHDIGITDVWLYPVKGAFPQDQKPETQQSVDELQRTGVLDAYKKHAIRYWWFERPVPDYAYETQKRADKPAMHLWDNSPQTDAFWSLVCEQVTSTYPTARNAGFAGFVYDGEAYYSFKGDESGKEKPWVWGGHEPEYGLEGNYYKRGLQVGKAIQSAWPGAKVIMVYAFGYPGERWWYQGFKDAGLDVFLGLEHTYGAGPAKPGGQWYQSWWQGRKTKATCDWKRTLFPFIADNQHMIAGLFPLDFSPKTANYQAQYFREQVMGAANNDPAGPIAVWLWPPFTPEGVSSVHYSDGDTAEDYLRVLRDFSSAFAR